MTRTRTAVSTGATMLLVGLVGLVAGCSASGSVPDAAATAVSSGQPPAFASAGPATSPATTVSASPTGRAQSSSTRSTEVSRPRPDVRLTIGTDDAPGVPSADEITHFADAVGTLSGGRILITPQWHADGNGHTDWDQRVAAKVQDGTLDLGLGPTWAWDVLGVDSFEPLQSPFLIDSDALVAKVVTDDALSGQLMSGLPEGGVVGISLWPEGLRHPFGFDKPLLTPADFKGQTVRSPYSDTSTALFAALGAKTSAEEPDATTMIGSQAEYALSPNGIGVANITFFPKINVLYANADRYATLDEATRSVIGRAAADTRQWAIDRTSDVAAGKDFCDGNHTLVVATDDQLTALKTATRSVSDRIEAAHPDTVAAITALKSVPPPPHATACAPAEAAATSHAPGPAEAALDGTYRFTVTAGEFAKAGLTDNDAFNNAGVQTYEMMDGTVTYRLDPSERAFNPTAGPGGQDEVDGSYQVDGDTITFRFPAYDNEVDRLRFATGPDGALHMTLIDTTGSDFGSLALLMTSKPWERIK